MLMEVILDRLRDCTSKRRIVASLSRVRLASSYTDMGMPSADSSKLRAQPHCKSPSPSQAMLLMCRWRHRLQWGHKRRRCKE